MSTTPAPGLPPAPSGAAPATAAATPAAPEAPRKTTVSIDDFRKVELKVAKVTSAALHPKADRLLVLQLDLGGEQRQVVSGIRQSYPDPAAMVGKQVILIANLEPATIRGVQSQGMILATQDAAGTSVLAPDRAVTPGSSVS